MSILFFKADPSANVQWPVVDMDATPSFTVVALHNDLDPDASVHDGFSYIGAYGVEADIKNWASTQPITAISKAALPDPASFFPAPFNEA